MRVRRLRIAGRTAFAGLGGLAAVVAVLAAAGPAAAAATTTRLSVSPTGEPSFSSRFPHVSNDGRFVVYRSGSDKLVAGDHNGFNDVFLHDRITGRNHLVSVSNTGAGGNSWSGGILSGVTPGGTRVVFESNASNLVDGDTNGTIDVFVRDRQHRTTVRASVGNGGVQANGASFYPSLSANGRFVAFLSQADNLVPGDTNGAPDIFVRDLQAGTTERVSVSSTGAQGDRGSLFTSISHDGRYVSFLSSATNLVPGDTNGASDAFVHDRLTGVTERVSVTSTGGQFPFGAGNALMNDDGRLVSFAASDTDGSLQVFVRVRDNRKTFLASVSDSGAKSNGGVQRPSISASGRFVTFESSATNLVPGGSNGQAQIYVRDLLFGRTVRASVSGTGAPANGVSFSPAVANNGGAAFESAATNLVPGAPSGGLEIYYRQP